MGGARRMTPAGCAVLPELCCLLDVGCFWGFGGGGDQAHGGGGNGYNRKKKKLSGGGFFWSHPPKYTSVVCVFGGGGVLEKGGGWVFGRPRQWGKRIGALRGGGGGRCVVFDIGFVPAGEGHVAHEQKKNVGCGVKSKTNKKQTARIFWFMWGGGTIGGGGWAARVSGAWGAPGTRGRAAEPPDIAIRVGSYDG